MATPANPLSIPEAHALFGYIVGKLGDPDSNVCNHTLHHAREWCEANGADWPAIAELLRNHGGYCDCEVLMNAAPQLDGEGAA